MHDKLTRWLAALVFLLGAVVLGVGALSASASDRPEIKKAKPSFRRSISSAAESDPVWQLGRTLFFDPILSASGHTACATCHLPSRAWGDGQTHSIGDAGHPLALRTPTLFAAGRLERLGWTGRFRDTAAVTLFAMTSPTNMAQPIASAVARLREQEAYAEAFRSAYGDTHVDADHVVAALAVFVNSIEASDAPFDAWLAGDEGAVGVEAKRGFEVFVGKGGCIACHAGPDLTDGSFHDIGSSTDIGRGKTFKSSVKLQYAFKTPSLRGVAERAPYMHDGGRSTLADVIALYDQGGIERPSRAEEVHPLHLTMEEKSDLIAFLKTLSGGTRFALRR